MGNLLGTLSEFQEAPALPVAPPTEPRNGENRIFVGPGHGPELQALYAERAAERPGPMSPERRAELARDVEKALNRLERAEARGPVPLELIAEIKNALGQLLAESLQEARAIAEEQFAGIFAKRHLRLMRQYRDFTITVWAERIWYQRVALAKKEDLLSLGRQVLEHLKEFQRRPGLSPMEDR
jgi:hypothetical protein